MYWCNSMGGICMIQFNSIKMGVPWNFNFFLFCNEPFWLALKLWRVWKFVFGPPNIDEKRTTLGKAYAIKVWCYWEHIGNFRTSWKPLGTWWEHSGNRLRKQKIKKFNTPQHNLLISSWMHSEFLFLFLFLNKPILIGLSPIFLELWAVLNRNTHLTLTAPK
jgi:hypothetical protein